MQLMQGRIKFKRQEQKIATAMDLQVIFGFCVNLIFGAILFIQMHIQTFQRAESFLKWWQIGDEII